MLVRISGYNVGIGDGGQERRRRCRSGASEETTSVWCGGRQAPGPAGQGATHPRSQHRGADITPTVLGIRCLQRLTALNIDALPVVANEPRIAPPLAGVGEFIAIGLNYCDPCSRRRVVR